MRRLALTLPRTAGLMAAVVLFWSWQCGYLWFGLAMAVALELPGLIDARWDFTDRHFERIADLSAVLLAGVTVYQFEEHGFRAIFPILETIPLVLLPLVLAQSFSTRSRCSYSALFLSVRRALRKGRLQTAGGVDVRYPYFLACLVAASAGRETPAGFLLGLMLLVAWALALHRPAERPLALWAGTLALVLAIGYGAQAGLIAVRRSLEPLLMEWFQEQIHAHRDPYRAQTAIGRLGRLKLSQRIVARVRPVPGSPVPTRLREAAYQVYSRHIWLAPGAPFFEIGARGGGTVFDLHAAPSGSPAHALEIAAELAGGRGVLMLPPTTYRLEGMNVDRVSLNRLGATKVNTGPSLLQFRARFGRDDRFVAEPGAADRRVPRDQLPLFNRLAQELGLRALPAGQAVAEVQAYFRRGFSYSLQRRRVGVFSTPLEDFIERTRSGHCEYFATATALLLRAAGVPARYVTGHAVEEWSELEQAYVVRRRHAHAWASAFVNGTWVDVDTTPAVWARAEAADPPWWLGGYDLASWLRHRFDQWRQADTEGAGAEVYIGLALVLSVMLAWRLTHTTRIVRRGASSTGAAGRPWRGKDSEFYELARTIERRWGGRLPGEPPRLWLERLRRTEQVPRLEEVLDDILPMHYRYRFDPEGLSDGGRARLRDAARQWLKALESGQERA